MAASDPGDADHCSGDQLAATDRADEALPGIVGDQGGGFVERAGGVTVTAPGAGQLGGALRVAGAG
ncbi:hypothetical protein, partial [Streptomyces sp. MBT58]|uniref:hypothetical protein n=1 Tax=Streptomyces sp. MBT58 TaxID=1488389 RepID=UPI001F380BC4